ncbi:hypothetical protein GCM10027259_56200 [Micromonospora palomenae]
MNSQQKTRTSMVTAALTAVILAASPGMAHAEGATSQDGPSVALKSLMAIYPGSAPVSADTIKIEEGVLLSLPQGHNRDVPVTREGAAAQPSTQSPDSRRTALANRAAGEKTGMATTAAAADGPVLAGCSYGYSCVYSDNNWAGYRLSFYTCALRDLSKYAYPGGGYWNDKMSSYSNNQTRGTRSGYYIYSSANSAWYEQFTSVAPYAAGSIPSPWNNGLDGIKVC